jgi:tetratricopeptide (TPR) repeat protein
VNNRLFILDFFPGSIQLNLNRQEPAIMSDLDASLENQSGSEAQGIPATLPTGRKPEHHHETQLNLLKESLTNEGEGAFSRWGLSMYYSLSDEEIEAQRETLGIEPADALDYYNRGCSKAGHEEFDEAVRLFSKALSMDGELNEASYNLALACEKTGETTEAIGHWKKHLSRLEDGEESEQIRQHISELSGP